MLTREELEQEWRDAIGHRMGLAHVHLMTLTGRLKVTGDEVAERLTKAHGVRAFSASQVSEYRLGKAMPSLDTLEAYAKACGVDPGWLAFGTLSAAPAPSTVKELSESAMSPNKKTRRRRRA